MYTVLGSDYISSVGGMAFVGTEPGRLYDMGIAYRAVEDAISFTISAEFNAGENKAYFTTKRELPEGNSIIEHGILLVTDKYYDLKYKDAPWLIVPGNSNVNKGTASTKGLKGTYILRASLTTAAKIYGRGYLKFKDSDGRPHTMYTGVVSCDTMPVVTNPWG